MNAINSNITNSKDIYTSADKHQNPNIIAKYSFEANGESGDDAATLSLSKEGIRRASELTENDKELSPGQIQAYRNVANELASKSHNPTLTQIQRNDIQDNINKVQLQLSETTENHVSPNNFTVII